MKFVRFTLRAAISRTIAAAVLTLAIGACAEQQESELDSLITQLADDTRLLRDVPFAEVVKAVTGKTLIPFDVTKQTDRELLLRIGAAMDAVLSTINAPDHPAQKEKRINEVSSHIEQEMSAALDAVAGFSCSRPHTASGKVQLSGYPDLRLVDKASGRVIYLDPKLYERGNRQSSLRTFYFEPKKETNKILDDAHHLIVGFEHDGRANGETWKFLNWELVDLAHFRVRLKAEFQGSNKDLYRTEAIVGTSRKQ